MGINIFFDLIVRMLKSIQSKHLSHSQDIVHKDIDHLNFLDLLRIDNI
jgi:hypothetical protein